jgi:hypothetical protein
MILNIVAKTVNVKYCYCATHGDDVDLELETPNDAYLVLNTLTSFGF